MILIDKAVSVIEGIGRIFMDIAANARNIFRLLAETLRWILTGPFRN